MVMRSGDPMIQRIFDNERFARWAARNPGREYAAATGLIAACCDAQEMIYRRPGVERDLAKMIDLALEHVLPSAASRAAQTSWRSVRPATGAAPDSSARALGPPGGGPY